MWPDLLVQEVVNDTPDVELIRSLVLATYEESTGIKLTPDEVCGDAARDLISWINKNAREFDHVFYKHQTLFHCPNCHSGHRKLRPKCE